MDDPIEPITVIILAIAFGLAATYVFRFFSTPPREPSEAVRGDLAARLRNPDFAGLEERLGCPLPSALRTLHENPSEAAKANFTLAPSPNAPPDRRHFIVHFAPCDLGSLMQDPTSSKEYLVLANGGGGNQYIVDPTSDDPPVLYFDREERSIRIACNSLSAFMKMPRFDISE
jgi:hypothetical protein